MKSITRFTRNIRGNKCLNCENDISEEDNFCSRCGQVNDLKKVSLKQYLSAYFDDFLSFDSRLLNTIATLIFKPGYVTKNYVEGKRMRYMNPFKLYLHITILFFLVVGIFKSIDKFKPVNEPPVNIIEQLKNPNGQVNLDSIKSEALLELNQADSPLDSATTSKIIDDLQRINLNNDSIQNQPDEFLQTKALIIHFTDSLLSEPGVMDLLKNKSISKSEKDTVMGNILRSVDDKLDSLLVGGNNLIIKETSQLAGGWMEITKKGNLKKEVVNHIKESFKTNMITYEIPYAVIQNSDDDAYDGRFSKTLYKARYFMDYQKDHPNANAVESLKKLGFETSYWNVFLFSKSKEWGEAFEDEGYWTELLDRILSRVSVALFFLLPIFTLMVSLLYIRRKYNYTENLVFVFHVQTVFFLLLLIFMIMARILDSDVVIPIFLVVFMIYLYKAMRNFYQQGRFKTFIKYILLNGAFMFLALIGGLIISFIAFLI